jgi:anti-sigma regulatory factor (Ser/Thr protein kinase)
LYRHREVEALLIHDWMRGFAPIPILDEASVSVARDAVRRAGSEAGLPVEPVASLVTATSELAHNQLAHARRGAVAVRPISRDGTAGLEVVAADRGPGIADPAAALEGRTRAPRGLGAGVGAVRRLCSELDIDVRLGEGSCLRARVFAEPVRRRREVAIFGRPHPGESTSGDHASFVRTGEGLWMVVVDGLGHGGPAREASDLAIATLLGGSPTDPRAFIEACHNSLRSTRGAVIGAMLLEEDKGEADVRIVGNVDVRLLSPKGSRCIGGSSLVVGSPQRLGRVGGERCTVDPRDAIVMSTDGIVRRGRDEHEPSLLFDHPVVLAQHLVQHHARSNDDVLVLVAR